MILAFGLKAEVGGTRRDIWLTLVADRADIKFADRLHAARCALDILQHNYHLLIPPVRQLGRARQLSFTLSVDN